MAIAGDTILIRPHTDWSQLPLLAISGYSEIHAGGTELFPIEVESGVAIKASSDSGTVNIWSSAASPPTSLFLLKGVAGGTAPLTSIEDLVLIGAKRGIEIAATDPGSTNEYVDFLGLIARCHFGWNQIAIDLVNNTTLAADIAIRECKIRTNFGLGQAGHTSPPVLQSPSVGMRFQAKSKPSASVPAQINVEIRNLLTLGDFTSMSPYGVSINGTSDFPAANSEFSRLIEVATLGSIYHLEHSSGSGSSFAPIPEVNMSIIGGNLNGKADPNDQNAGWDVGLFATTDRFEDGPHKDFSSGYRIETSGTTFDKFKLAGIHCNSSRWGRGVLRLNGNTTIKRTGYQASPNPDLRLYNGVHVTSIEAYMGLHSTNATISNNLGNGVFLKTKSSIWIDDHQAPTGGFINLNSTSILQNGNHGLVHLLNNDGIVGGAWHFPNGNRSLFEWPNFDYSVDYGPGVVNKCNISSNGKSGLFFRTDNSTSSAYFNTRFVNCIIWNNPQGGYLADLRGPNSAPVFLAPLGHCTLAGNGDDSTHPYSLEIIEQDRPGLLRPTYYWSETLGELSTKFYNTILERKSSSADDFEPSMITGSDIFLVDDGPSISINEIGAAGLRYQDGGITPIFSVSTFDATPFVDSSTWTTLDPSKFYLLNHGTFGVFGTTPVVLPIFGNETAFDHQDDPRPDPSSGLRDKGADEHL